VNKLEEQSLQKRRLGWRHAVVLLGVGLLAYLIFRAGPATLLHNVKAIGWGLLFVIALGGLAHVVKTCAWRLVLPSRSTKFSTTLALRLVSEAVGQLGIVGQVLGEAMRVSLLGPNVPVGSGISSVTLDRGIFIASGAAVTIVGLLTTLAFVALPGAVRTYAFVFTGVLIAFVAGLGLMIRRRVRFVSGTVSVLSRVPRLRNWFESKKQVIDSAEQEMLNFYHVSPGAFWLSVILNFLTHALAIAEVYFILLFMGVQVGAVGALILESLTKVINTVGSLNPGNVGTYEGGNMLIGRVLGLAGGTGLTLAICRRVRSIFWAIIGGLCLLWFSQRKEQPATQAEAA
jgi:uncharacterized protein (TIRG00374 family)